MMRKKDGTLTKYINAEETAYRKLQKVLKEAMEDNTDEYSEDENGWYDPNSSKSQNAYVDGYLWNAHTSH